MNKNTKKFVVAALLALTMAGTVSCSCSSVGGSSESSAGESQSAGASSGEGSSASSGASSSNGGSSASSSSSGSSSDSTGSSNSSSGTSSSSSSSSGSPSGEISLTGVEGASTPKGRYFDPLKGVSAKGADGADITSAIDISGNVDYSIAGDYPLVYTVSDNGKKVTKNRTITVTNDGLGSYARKKSYGEEKTVNLGKGSYLEGNSDLIDFRPADPSFVDDELIDEAPLPTNRWWSGFETANYGGVTLAATNPLYVKLSAAGVSLTNKGTGFTQYFTVNDTFGTAQTTMSQFAPTFNDISVASASMGSNPVSKVIGYSENSVRLSMRNSSAGADELVANLVQGSPFVFFESDSHTINLNLRLDAVTKPYIFYDLSGNVITDSYTGDGIVIELPQAHCGYATTYPSVGIGAALYKDFYYIVNAPKGSSFAFSQLKHPSNEYKDHVAITLNGSNYLSVGMLPSLGEAGLYHAAGYSFIDAADSSFSIDKAKAEVTTTFREAVQHVDGGNEEPLLALLPHQWKHSDAALTSSSFKTMRGTNKVLKGRTFATTNEFRGLLPGFTTPLNGAFSAADAKTYATNLLNATVPTGSFEEGGKNFIDAPGPYWNAKALYPLSQAILAMKQLGETELTSQLVARLKDDMVDWFTYSGTDDDRFLYYDEVYGTMYYSNDDFSTGSRLSDHHFTSGYLVYASAVLSMVDGSFLSDYGDIVTLLARDYADYQRNDGTYPYLRSFDTWAGHSWADGRGDFGDGNDEESSGESLNSWAAAYLFGTVSGNQDMVDAAIYGYATEMESVKQYWFNYDGDNWDAGLSNNTHVVGIVWGAKNDCATWFGSNPEFIYGIHWLPTGEYLTGYTLGDQDAATFTTIYDEMLSKLNGTIRTWWSNMWAMQALIDPDGAVNAFDSSKILGDDYPYELTGSYWMVNALAGLGRKSLDDYAELKEGIAASVYEKGETKTLLAYNSTASAQSVQVVVNGGVVTKTIAANSYANYSL
ncbi:MAG: glycosyl hydrolase [Bacilli bacterium]|nr:glycosyl hydrolase [Bacilli bacterium]